MPLTLTVLRCPDAVPPETRTVMGGEFSVGRGPGVDWILPDPERLLSKRHFAVAYRSGNWQIADTSTNGTTMNRDPAPIGHEAVRDLRDGDRISLGAYEIEVRVAEDAMPQAGFGGGMGFGAPPPARGASPFADPFSQDPFAPPPAARRPFDDPPPSGFGAIDTGAQLPHDFDPLAPEPADAGFLGPTQSDHRPVLEDAFQPPSVGGQMAFHSGGKLPGDDLLPDDWDKELLDGINAQPAPATPLPASPPPPAPHAFSQPAPSPAAPFAPQPAPPPDAHPFAQPAPVAEPFGRPTAQPMGQGPVHPTEPPAHDPFAEPQSGPAAHPAAPSAADPFAELDQAPIARQPAPPPSAFSQPMVQPVVQPMVQPVVQPAVQPMVQPVAQPIPQPVVQPVAQPVVHAVPQPVSPEERDPFAEPPAPGRIAELPAAAGAARAPTPFDEPFDLEPPAPAPRPVAAPVRPAPPAAPPSAALPTAADGALLAAFLQGAEMSDVTPADPAAMMRNLGEAFRTLVGGLRAVLIARASIKSEFRIEQTMIRARGNNPLKFSAGDDDALAALLGAGRRTDMTAAAAVADALKDIRLHELASMAAMQTAVRSLLDGLDPAKLRAQAEQGGGLSVLPAQRKARAWDSYEALHARTVQALADDFDSVFGKAFARAYERSLDEVAARER